LLEKARLNSSAVLITAIGDNNDAPGAALGALAALLFKYGMRDFNIPVDLNRCGRTRMPASHSVIHSHMTIEKTSIQFCPNNNLNPFLLISLRLP
jgi:hypothetical protein